MLTDADESPTAGIDALFVGLPQLLSITEVAALLRMSSEGITKWIRRGTLPVVRFDDRAFRAFRADMRDLLVANCHRDGVEPPRAPDPGRIDRLLKGVPTTTSLREVADLLAFSPQGIRQWTKRDLLPSLEVGGKVMIFTADVRALLERSYSAAPAAA